MGLWLKVAVLSAEKDRPDVKQRGEMVGGLVQSLSGGLDVAGYADLVEVGKLGDFVGEICFAGLVVRIIQPAICSRKAKIFERRFTIVGQAGGKEYTQVWWQDWSHRTTPRLYSD